MEVRKFDAIDNLLLDRFLSAADITTAVLARAYLARRGPREVLACYQGGHCRTKARFTSVVELARYMLVYW